MRHTRNLTRVRVRCGSSKRKSPAFLSAHTVCQVMLIYLNFEPPRLKKNKKQKKKLVHIGFFLGSQTSSETSELISFIVLMAVSLSS